MDDKRIVTRKRLRENIIGIYDAIAESQISMAISCINMIEKDITVYYNTRGLDCTVFYPLISRMRNFMKRYRNTSLHRKKMYSYLFEFNSQIKKSAVIRDESGDVDVMVVLKTIFDDLIDDFSEFNVAPGMDNLESNKKTLELIRNDLLEIRDLKSLFMDRSDDDKRNFLELSKAINSCMVILPQLNDVSFSATTVKIFRESFSTVFDIISEMLIPDIKHSSDEDEKIEKQKEMMKSEAINQNSKIPKELDKTGLVDADSKSLNKMVKELGIDLKEMERKAKKGMGGDEKDGQTQ